jgi:hypothetical protein
MASNKIEFPQGLHQVYKAMLYESINKLETMGVPSKYWAYTNGNYSPDSPNFDGRGAIYSNLEDLADTVEGGDTDKPQFLAAVNSMDLKEIRRLIGGAGWHSSAELAWIEEVKALHPDDNVVVQWANALIPTYYN